MQPGVASVPSTSIHLASSPSFLWVVVEDNVLHVLMVVEDSVLSKTQRMEFRPLSFYVHGMPRFHRLIFRKLENGNQCKGELTLNFKRN